MPVLLGIKEGWTGELGPFTLKSNGTPFGLSGFTVTPVLRKHSGELVSDAGSSRKASDQSANPGEVYFTPAAGIWDAQETPYTLAWKVVDGTGAIEYFPNGPSDTITVSRP